MVPKMSFLKGIPAKEFSMIKTDTHHYVNLEGNF